MILLCYDGSPDAEVMGRSGAGFGLGAPMNYEEIDASSEQAAAHRAQEGADRARRAGLDPQPRTRASRGTIADTILSEADEVGAGAIVMGTRGLTGLKSMLLGSVSHALIQHADRAVIVVPSAEVAAERAAHRR